MIKKISFIVMAAFAIVFAGPPFAGASTGFTDSGGSLLPSTTRITATAFGPVTITSSKLGSLRCENMVIGAWLSKNNASEGVEATGISGESSASSCWTPGNIPFALKEIVLTNLKSPASTPGKGTASFSFTASLPGSQVCKYKAENDEWTYTANSNVISFSDGPLVVTSGTNCGISRFDGRFRLETTTTKSLVFVM